MKKLAIALTAIAAFTAPAVAADMPVRAPVYQPPAPVYNWTGFYIFGGGGGGLWNADSNVVAFPSGVGLTRDQRLGGSGWFGTVGAGWDWQFSHHGCSAYLATVNSAKSAARNRTHLISLRAAKSFATAGRPA